MLRIVCALAGLLLACGSAAPRSPALTQASGSPRAAPTPAAEIRESPNPTPTPLTVSGRGSLVRSLALSAGAWRVDWEASGRETFTVVLMSERTQTLVEVAAPAAGHTEFQVAGGSYQITVSAKTLDWRLVFTQGE